MKIIRRRKVGVRASGTVQLAINDFVLDQGAAPAGVWWGDGRWKVLFGHAGELPTHPIIPIIEGCWSYNTRREALYAFYHPPI